MKISTLIILIALLFSGCKKYDEGPDFTLRTPKARLTRVTWKVYDLVANGVRSPGGYASIRHETFSDNGVWSYSEKLGQYTTEVKGTWKFVDDKNQVEVTWKNLSNPSIEDKMTYNIVELSKKKFHFYLDGEAYGRPKEEHYDFYCEPF